MKNIYFILGLLLICLNSQAQELYPRIGLTASVNTNRPPYYDIHPRIGFTVGAGYNHPLTNVVSLQMELNYIQKAFKSDYEESTSVQYGEDVYEVHEIRTNRYAISYLEIPLLLKVRLLHDDVFVMGGPSLAMGLGGSHSYELHRTSSYLDPLHEEGTGKIKFGSGSPTNNKDVYFDNRWDVGVMVGFGALFFKKVQLECRYNLGTVNVNKHADSKNRCLQISIATPIQLKR